VYLDSRHTMPPLDRNIFGSFLEHRARAIYEDIYDPGSKLADSNGLLTDIADEIKHLGMPIVRYPGGNFVSGYNWLDGVGPKKDRPRKLDKAWNTQSRHWQSRTSRGSRRILQRDWQRPESSQRFRRTAKCRAKTFRQAHYVEPSHAPRTPARSYAIIQFAV
jgi:hypothetical protein